MLEQLRNVVVLGGTGHFGARICRRLLQEQNVHLFVSSRSEASARNLVSILKKEGPKASLASTTLNLGSASFASDLMALKPQVVVHTAGPFQDQDYKVAKACIACGSHYVDLADGRHFVEGFSSELHKDAEDGGVLLVAGASTLPGLSSAVIEEFAADWQSIDEIEIVIAPAQQTPRGSSTIRAVMSYCGKPFDVLVNGRWQRHYGWQSLKSKTYPNIGRRLSAVCDVPDLGIFPQRHPTLESVVFRAALESKLEHVGLWLFATMTRLGFVHDWGSFAGVFQKLSELSRLAGGDVGGMQISIKGRNQTNVETHFEWNLVAGQNHGPEIPVSPALILIRKLVRDGADLVGAYPCYGLISLQEFDAEVAELDIRWTTKSEPMIA